MNNLPSVPEIINSDKENISEYNWLEFAIKLNQEVSKEHQVKKYKILSIKIDYDKYFPTALEIKGEQNFQFKIIRKGLSNLNKNKTSAIISFGTPVIFATTALIYLDFPINLVIGAVCLSPLIGKYKNREF